MKITLSVDELKTLIREHFKVEGHFELVVDGMSELAIDCGAAFILQQMKPFMLPSGDVWNDKKIAAIKRLRELFLDKNYVPSSPHDTRPSLIGLAVAKRTVENWPHFVDYVKRNGRFPAIVGNDWAEVV